MSRPTGPADRLLARAARRIVEAQQTSPAVADVRRAQLCVMHHLACAERGRELPWSRAARRVAVGGGAADEVFVGAVLGQSTLAEDLHRPSLIHPGSVVVPAAIAAARRHGASPERFVAAVLAGYDVVCRIGTALKTDAFVARGFRPSAVFGPFGAAAATAVVLGLKVDQAASALGIAANTAAGLREWANAGSTDVYLQNGFAARNGFVAALLAAGGVVGPSTALAGSAGMGQAYAGGDVDWEAAVESFDQGAVVHQVEFKRYPACSAVQTVLEVAVRIRDRHQLDPSQIDRVVVHTHRHGKRNPGCDNPGPWHGVGQAQMSNQFGVALALSGVPVDIDGYGRYQDPGLAALARRVDVVEDPAFTRRFPERSSARIEVRCRDTSVVEELDDASALSAAEVQVGFTAVQLGHGADVESPSR